MKFKTALIVSGVLLVGAIVWGGITAASLYRSVSFDPAWLAAHAHKVRGTIFTDRFGRELRFLPDVSGERGRWIAEQDIPDTVKNAFIAAEDQRFYDHPGFDLRAICRAFWHNVTKRKIISGASTISQQLVRLVAPHDSVYFRSSKRRGYRTKLMEILLSVRMERRTTKQNILEQYLNRVPMGNNLIGIETAAWAYFGKSCKDLSVSESALLASIPKAPGDLNPYGKNYERLLSRRNWVLQRMRSLGMISEEAYVTAQDEQPHLRTLAFRNHAPHLIDQLTLAGIAGDKVRTTINIDLQDRVRQILTSHRERLRYKNATQSAVIVIDNRTMEVLATVGSMEYSEKDGGYNNGVLATHSAGSTLKPFLYALALETGHTVTTLLEDTEQKYRLRRGQYQPDNYDKKTYGPVTMRTALGNSFNISAVKMLNALGEEPFYDLLKRLTLINDPSKGPQYYGLGIAIGNPEVNLEQLAAAYAMLANRGVYRPPVYIKSAEKPKEQAGNDVVLLPQTAYIITDILSDPTARQITFGRFRAMDFPFKTAIKTGTSTHYRDLWAVGYTTEYTVAVWTGNFDGSPTNKMSGASASMPIVWDIINHLYRYSAPEPFRRPRSIQRLKVCGYSGMKPSPSCPHVIAELFITGTGPVSECSFHTKDNRHHELSAPYAGWLYEKKQSDASGWFKLAGFGNDLDSVFDDPGDLTTEELKPAVTAKNSKNAVLKNEAVVRPTQTHFSIGKKTLIEQASYNVPSDSRKIKILYPFDRDRFVLLPGKGHELIRLKAAVQMPEQYVDWYINGNFYRRTGPPYQTDWQLEAGTYIVTAVIPCGVGDSVEIKVD